MQIDPELLRLRHLAMYCELCCHFLVFHMIKSRVIFVGNIPYDQSETQLINIFSEVGIVLSFRLVFDRDTGKPKGYGFCTFQDYETAASAVRNLNNYDVGGRQLRVDFAEADKEALEDGDKRRHPGDQNPQSSVETIPQIVSQMDPQQLAEVLSYLKLMATSNPEQVHTLLNQNPQIAYGVLQALLQMNIVDQFSMQRIISAQSTFN